MSYRSTPSFAIGGVEPNFRCIVCGAETAFGPSRVEDGSVCPAHCEDHEYERADRGGHACMHCDQDAPDDWYYVDDWG